MKKLFVVLLAVALSVGFLQTVSFAEKGKMGERKGHQGKMSTEDELFRKIKKITMHQDELGITDEQLAKIKTLKMDLKKDLIRKDADIEVLALDIKAALSEDQIDLGKVNKLIDQKSDVKKAKPKSVIAALAELKKAISKDQMNEVEGLCKEKMMQHKK